MLGMSYLHDVERIRGKIKRYKTESVVTHLLNRLHASSAQNNKAYDRAWISCLMLDWVLEVEPSINAVDASEHDVYKILNEIWELQSKASNIDGSENVFLTIRSFLIKQLRFQENQNIHVTFLVRLYSMVCAKNTSNFFEAEFKKATGVSLEKFFVFALFLLVLFKDKKLLFLTYTQLIVKLHPFYSIFEIDAMIHALGANLYSAREFIQAKRNNSGPIKASDYHAEPFVIERPLICLDKGISIYHTYVATIGISEFVLRTLKSLEPQTFRDKFTKVFERFVCQTLLEHNIDVVDENEINRLYKKNNKKGKVVDFICCMQGGTVYIDAKGVEPSQHVLVSDSPKIIKDKIKNFHIKGILQISECIEILKSLDYDNISTYENRFALIVTHQDFYLGHAKQLYEYLGQDYNHDITHEIKNKILLENIHFCSVSDLEIILTVCKETKTSLIDFLRFCTQQDKDIKTSMFDMQQRIHAYMTECTGINAIPLCSESTLKSYDKLHKELCSAMKLSQKYWGGKIDELLSKSEIIKHSALRTP
ncbi:TPA: hypothetical protein P2Q91_003510 [Aeromonas veronii]|nr:hypothetical protein [Aeromonas veronii]HDO1348915.1 hypothetical protein [Aeromonas veronii]HDO1351967.1 hypothetical protein [Aeromonas veronii]HDO1362582.1 hypothetical protein [Aeromonas veronii]